MSRHGVIVKSEKEAPRTELEKLGLHRVELSSLGLSGDEIDRIFRGIFVYSTGFHQIVKDLIYLHGKTGNFVGGKVWCLYTRVMEEMDPELYQSGITKVETEKTEEYNRMQSNLQEQIDALKASLSKTDESLKIFQDKASRQDIIVNIEKQRNFDLNRLYQDAIKIANSEKHEKEEALNLIRQLENTIKTNLHDITVLRTNLESANGGLKGLANVNESLSKQLKGVTESLLAMKEQESITQGKLRDCAQQKTVDDAKQKEMEFKLKLAVDTIQATQNEKNELRKVISEWAEKDSKSQREINDLLAARNAKDTAYLSLENQLRLKNKDYSELRAAYEDSIQTVLDLKNDILGKVNMIAAKDVESSQLALTSSRKIDELNEKLREYKYIEDEITKEKNRVEEYKKIAKAKQAETVNFKKTMSELQDELQGAKRSIFTKDSEIKELMSQISKQKVMIHSRFNPPFILTEDMIPLLLWTL